MREKERGSKAVWNISENLSVMVPWPVPEWHQVVQKCSHCQYDCQQVVHKLSQICHQTITKLSLGRLKVAPQKFQSSPQVFLMYSPSSPQQIPISISPGSPQLVTKWSPYNLQVVPRSPKVKTSPNWCPDILSKAKQSSFSLRQEKRKTHSDWGKKKEKLILIEARKKEKLTLIEATKKDKLILIEARKKTCSDWGKKKRKAHSDSVNWWKTCAPKRPVQCPTAGTDACKKRKIRNLRR